MADKTVIPIDRPAAPASPVSLTSLTSAQQRNPAVVLAALARLGRYSALDTSLSSSPNQTLAETMSWLVEAGLMEVTHQAYPWFAARVTESGEKWLAARRAKHT